MPFLTAVNERRHMCHICWECSAPTRQAIPLRPCLVDALCVLKEQCDAEGTPELVIHTLGDKTLL